MDDTNTTPSTSGGRSFNPIVAIVIVVLLIGAGALILSAKNKSSQQAAPSATTPTASVPSPTTMMDMKASPSGTVTGVQGTSATGTQGAVKEFTVHGSNFSFSPSTMTVKKGDTVKITFVNDSGFHNWVLDEFNAKTATIPGGQTTTTTFTADKAGTFEYYCGVDHHRQMGMKGTLIVQ